MDKSTRGQKALITGASRGIGRGIALAMAMEGYDIAFCHYNDEDNAAAVARIIEEEYGRKCVVYNVNLEEEQAPEKLVNDAIDALGHLDVLVNNAGITLYSEITQLEVATIDRLYSLDFRAPLMAIRSTARHMIEQNISGSIINITSSRAERAYPIDSVYGGVKAALTRASQSIALELSTHQIRVNCIAPGAIATNPAREEHYRQLGKKIPLNRVGTPEDIGNTVVWLSSKQASYLTGTTIRADGGLILPGMPERDFGASEFGWGRVSK